MLSGNGRGRVADQAVKSKGGRLIIKFTQRDGYGSSIEFIERRGSDGADVDEKNNVFGPACRNSKRLVEYIGGFAAVQTFVSKTTYLTSAASGMAESKVAGVDGDRTVAAGNRQGGDPSPGAQRQRPPNRPAGVRRTAG